MYKDRENLLKLYKENIKIKNDVISTAKKSKIELESQRSDNTQKVEDKRKTDETKKADEEKKKIAKDMFSKKEEGIADLLPDEYKAFKQNVLKLVDKDVKKFDDMINKINGMTVCDICKGMLETAKKSGNVEQAKKLAKILKKIEEREKALTKGNEGKGSEGKSSEGKSSEGKGSEGKGSEGKSSEGKSSEGKSSEGKSSEGKGSEGKGSEGKGDEGKGGEGKGGEGKGNEGKNDEVIIDKKKMLKDLKELKKKSKDLNGVSVEFIAKEGICKVSGDLFREEKYNYMDAYEAGLERMKNELKEFSPENLAKIDPAFYEVLRQYDEVYSGMTNGESDKAFSYVASLVGFEENEKKERKDLFSRRGIELRCNLTGINKDIFSKDRIEEIENRATTYKEMGVATVMKGKGIFSKAGQAVATAAKGVGKVAKGVATKVKNFFTIKEEPEALPQPQANTKEDTNRGKDDGAKDSKDTKREPIESETLKSRVKVSEEIVDNTVKVGKNTITLTTAKGPRLKTEERDTKTGQEL